MTYRLTLQEIVYDALIEFGNTVEKYLTLGGGADSSGRNTKSAYRIKPGEISGVINVSLWHAIGHTVSTLGILSVHPLLTDGKRLQRPSSPEISFALLRTTPRVPKSYSSSAKSPTSSTRRYASWTLTHTSHIVHFDKSSRLHTPTFALEVPSIPSYSKADLLYTTDRHPIISTGASHSLAGLLFLSLANSRAGLCAFEN